MKLNIGCGKNILKGFINVDRFPQDSGVRKVDLEKPLPFKDNSFSFIKAYHILEHIIKYEELLTELWRVCKPNAIIDIEVPHFSSSSAFCSTHVRFFRCYEFESEGAKRIPSKTPYNFESFDYQLLFCKGINPLNYLGRIFNISQGMRLIFDGTFVHNIFLADTVRYKLKAIKK